MVQNTILCVDDENDNLDALERLLRGKFTVLKANSGKKALQILDQYPEQVSVIISDQRMPEMTGVEFLSKTISKFPDTVRILLTGYTDIESVVAAINNGEVYKYISKPWDPVDFVTTITRACEKYWMKQELKQKNLELQAALKELSTLDQAKNQFMILVNHELKTPLTSLLSFGELLKEEKLTDEQMKYTDRIMQSADRLKKLVDDILLVVRGETKNLAAKIRPFNFSDLENSANKEVQASAEKRRQKIEIEKFDKKIVGDPELLRQVLQRLLHNASKFGNENSTISVKVKLAGERRLEISVYNDGPAIPDNVMEKISKPFFIDEDVMNHSSGLGLGLSICHSILKAHGSQLTTRNLKAGVEMSFVLPCL